MSPIAIEINANFHIIGEKSVLDKDDPVFREYRRKWEESPKNFYTGEFPLHLDIEASSACNLRCEFCETSYEKIGTRYGYMEFEVFKRIIDEGAEYGLYAIKLNSGARGEPLLHKNIAEMVEYAKKKGIIDVYMNTNAGLLTQELGRKLIDAGLDSYRHILKEMILKLISKPSWQSYSIVIILLIYNIASAKLKKGIVS